MGFIGGLLLFPVVGPVWGFRMFAERLYDEAESDMYDEARGYADLIELSMLRNAGRISDAEFADQQAVLLERLSAIREYRDDVLNAELNDDVDAVDDIDAEADEQDFIDAEPVLSEVES